MKFIITAGGQGTKLWPYSTESTPKQFQKIVKDESLFSYTVNVLLKRYSPEDIYVSTKKRYVGYGVAQAPRIPLKNYIVEPDIQNGRGPGEGLVFLKMSMMHPNEPFMLIQVDCFRLPEDSFLNMIEEAEKIVTRDRKFITGGIKAVYPILGIDYIRLGDRIDTKSPLDVYGVEEFVDRSDDYYKTKELIENFHIVTHSNHTCWYPELMLEAYKKYKPEWYDGLMAIKEAIGTPDEEAKIEEIYSKMPKGSTEEVTRHIFPDSYIVVLPFKWTDFGTWDSIYEFFSKGDQPYIDGENIVTVDTTRSLIKSSSKEKLIATLGIDNLIIVDTEDVLLVLPRDKSDALSKIREALKEKGLSQYL